MTSLLNFLCFLYLYRSLVLADILQFHNETISWGGNYLTLSKYGRADVPNWSLGNGRSFIDLSKLTVVSSCLSNNNAGAADNFKCREAAQFDVLLFLAGDWLDYWPNYDYCCTEELVQAGKCSDIRLNKLIIPSNLQNYYLTGATVLPNARPVAVEHESISHEITVSGLYVLLLANCNPQAAPFSLNGSVISIDPYGYLPGDLFGLLPFYLMLCIMYLLYGLTWIDSNEPLHRWIVSLLMMAGMESVLLFVYYFDWNQYGTPSFPLFFIASVCGVGKRTLSRVLLLLMVKGFGIISLTMGKGSYRVFALGIVYATSSLIYTILANFPRHSLSFSHDSANKNAVSWSAIVLAGADLTFLLWIVVSIKKQWTALKNSSSQTTAAVVYRHFVSIMLSIFLVAAIWIVVGSAIFQGNHQSRSPDYWQYHWATTASWEIISFLVFLTMVTHQIPHLQ